MKARVAGIAGSVLALTVIGGFAAASTFQPSQAPAPVRVVVPAVVQPVTVATVAPTVAPTTAAPVVKAPAPVQSTQAPAPVAAPKKVVVVPKAVQPAAPAPVPADVQNNPNLPHDANGNVILPPVRPATGPQIDGHGVPIPTPTP